MTKPAFHDIGPNTTLQVCNFHVLCKDYLAIDPSIDLRLSLFCCNSLHEGTGLPYLQCGAIAFQRRKDSVFPKLAFANRVRECQRTFFYCKDTSPEGEVHLPAWFPATFVSSPAFSSKPDPASASSIRILTNRIVALTLHGLTGLDLIYCWTKWHPARESP